VQHQLSFLSSKEKKLQLVKSTDTKYIGNNLLKVILHGGQIVQAIRLIPQSGMHDPGMSVAIGIWYI